MVKRKLLSSNVNKISRGKIRDYMQSIVLMANEVLDFEAHNVMVIDRASQQFNRGWHFIEGFYLLKKEFPENYKKLLLKVLKGKSAILKRQIIPVNGISRIKSDVIYAPMKIDERSIGVLYILPPDGQRFSKYDSNLMTCIISIVDTGFSKNTARQIGKDLLTPLQFCLLHRRHHLLAATDVNDVINHYYDSLASEKEFAFFSSNIEEISINFRLTNQESGNITLTFAEPMKNVRKKVLKEAIKLKEVLLTTQEVENWISKWSASDSDPHNDIDKGYHNVFPEVRSHIAVPCKYDGKLYGILSIDSHLDDKFTPLHAQMLYIIGAQMASVVANAKASSELAKKQAYLESVLDAIPDQITIVDKNARIKFMNKARRNKFMNAKIGNRCWEIFEDNKHSACRGCYTLKVAKKGETYKQALWKYMDPKTHIKSSYVEISAGQLQNKDGNPLQPLQAVEVVRDVNEREEMLKWMSEVQSHLLTKNSPKKLWEDIGDGLRRMGFENYKIYEYVQSHFFGKTCSENLYKGKDFTQFSLDPLTDIPSKRLKSLYEKKELKPVRFIVNKKSKKTSKREKEWNYITQYLAKIPSEYVESFFMEDIRSWVEIPIYFAGTLFGKIVVEKKVEKISQDGSQDAEPNAYEMAILVSFGKFVSIVMHTAIQHVNLVKSVQESAKLEFGRYPKAILDLYSSKTIPTAERLSLLNWAILLPIVSPRGFDINRVQYFLIKKKGKNIYVETNAGIGAFKQKNLSAPDEELHNKLAELFNIYPPNKLDKQAIAAMSDELKSISHKFTPRLSDRAIEEAITNKELEDSILGKALRLREPIIVNPSTEEMRSLDRKFLELAQETESPKHPFAYIPITIPQLSITQQYGFLYLDNVFKTNTAISPEKIEAINAFVSILGGLCASEKTDYELRAALGMIGHDIKEFFGGSDFEVEMAKWRCDILISFLNPEKTVQIDRHLEQETQLYLASQEVISYIEQEDKDQSSNVKINPVPYTEEYFKGSKELLQTVLYQLLHNAVKFTSLASWDDREVGIRIDDSSGKSGYIHLIVWDTGIGIADDLKPRLGKEWYHNEGLGGGAGIGLMTCYKLLEKWTESSDNFEIRDHKPKGSEFHIWIPKIYYK